MPTNVSTSFFFINLLFQARRAGSNPRPSCVPRCVAARDKSRPWRRAMARAYREDCARPRPSAWALNSRLGVLVPSGDRSGLTEPAGETLAIARAHRTASARARPSAWVLKSRRVAARGDSRLGVLVPSGDRPGPTEPAGETLASLVLIKPLAHVRGGGCVSVKSRRVAARDNSRPRTAAERRVCSNY